jgi:CRP-like cAMP-binding protein
MLDKNKRFELTFSARGIFQVANGLIKLKQGEYLFKEGQESDACFVVKTGRIAITKDKGNSEIELAQLKPGQMFGEMAFFDNKPRSAGAKAMTPETTVIALPFAALNAQFKTFPEWLKAMVKTVNDHLREANKKIKNLEKVDESDGKMFDPYLTIRLTGILALVGKKYGEIEEGNIVIPGGTLRRYTIQVFQQPTFKMQKMMEVLSAMQIMKVEDQGEGRQKITIFKYDMLSEFVDYYTKWLFAPQEKRTEVKEKDLPLLRALLAFTRNQEPNAKGMKRVNLTQIQNDSMKDLGYVVSVTDWDPLIERKLVGEKMQEKEGVFCEFDFNDIKMITPIWELVYTIERVQTSR